MNDPLKIPAHLDPNQRNERSSKTDAMLLLAATNLRPFTVPRDARFAVVEELAEFIRGACKCRCAARFVEMNAAWIFVTHDMPERDALVADIHADIDRGEQDKPEREAAKAMVTALYTGRGPLVVAAMAAWNERGCANCALLCARGESRASCRCQQ